MQNICPFQILKLLSYSCKNNVTILQTTRWEELLNERINMGGMMGLSEEFVRELYVLIHEESIRKQTEIMNQNPAHV